MSPEDVGGAPAALFVRVIGPLVLDAARWMLAAAAAVLLYRALGEDGQGWGGGPGVVARRTLFALLGGALLLLLSGNWGPDPDSRDGQAFRAFATGVTAYRGSYTDLAHREPRLFGRPAAIDKLEEAARLLPESVYFQRYAGIALAEQGNYPEALKRFERGMKLLAMRAPERARSERAAWRTLFGPQRPDEKTTRAALDVLATYRLGWIGRVAEAAALWRLPDERPGKAQLARVRRDAREYMVATYIAGISALLLVPQVGLIVLGVGIVLIMTGVLRPIPRQQHPVGAILWEGFLLYLASPLLMGPFLTGGRGLSPESDPGLVATVLLLPDVLQLLALVYVWWRLRRRGLGLAEIGLTRSRLLAGIGLGVAATALITPLGVLVGYVAERLGTQLFPGVAPPFHPLTLHTATSSDVLVRISLFLGAALAAPVLEEVFFRGCLYGALRRRFGIAAGMLGSAAVFSVLHPQLPLGFLPIAFLGAAYAALYEWRQSLTPCMAAHAVNNGLVTLALTLAFPLDA